MKNERLKKLAEEAQEIRERLKQIQAEEAQERQNDLRRLVHAFKTDLADHGLALEDALELLAPSSSRGPSGKRKTANPTQAETPVRYKEPDGPGTWGGVGRKPKWVRAAEAKGLTLEDLKAQS